MAEVGRSQAKNTRPSGASNGTASEGKRRAANIVPHNRDEIAHQSQKYHKLLKQFINGECRPTDRADTCPKSSEFVIALAPDPIHTHLALTFDRTMEAIQEALQDEGYTFVRSIMPWDAGAHPESDQVLERLGSLRYERRKQEQPGLMVFRKKNRPLFVLVVGETPAG